MRAQSKSFAKSYCRVARTQGDVDQAQRLRFRCISSDLKIPVEIDPRVGREISGVDNLPTTHHLLLYCGQALIGTARLALPNSEAAAASGTEMGFEIEREFDLRSLSAFRENLAEVARIFVRRPWRRTKAVLRLYEGVYCLSRELGVSYWIGGVDCQTPRADEADLMWSVLRLRGLVHPELRVEARLQRDAEADHGAAVAMFYVERERDCVGERLGELRIASTLVTFTHRLGARCVGRPARHPSFARFVMPMLAHLDDLPRSTFAKFDLSLLGPSIAAPRLFDVPSPNSVSIESSRTAP